MREFGENHFFCSETESLQVLKGQLHLAAYGSE